MNAHDIAPAMEMPACRDCHWVSTDGTADGWLCHAPDVVALLDGNTFTFCSYAREFRVVCGAAGRFFKKREGLVNVCLRVA